MPPSVVQQNQATQSEDEDSETMDLQNSVSDHSKKQQNQEDSQRKDPQNTEGTENCCKKAAEYTAKGKEAQAPKFQMKTMKNLKMSLEPLQTLSLLYQYYHHQGPAASSHGPPARTLHNDEDSEYSDEYSAQSHQTLEEHYSIQISAF